MHYVDDSLYLDDPNNLKSNWLTTAKAMNANPQLSYAQCADRLDTKEAIDLCAEFSFTARGSENVVAMERAAVKEANISFYDTFAMTRNQPLASKPGDGRHYIALLPKELVALSSIIRAWLNNYPAKGRL